MKTIHLRAAAGDGEPVAVCGRHGPDLTMTTLEAFATCRACLRSREKSEPARPKPYPVINS